MNFYMLRDKKTDLYYKRVHGRSYAVWVPQNEASVWTTPAGANSCRGAITRQNARMRYRGPSAIRDPEVVTISVTKPRVAFYSCSDWEGLYIEDKLVLEGHHVHLEDIFRLLGIEAEFISDDDDEVEWLANRGTLPPTWDEVKRSGGRA